LKGSLFFQILSFKITQKTHKSHNPCSIKNKRPEADTNFTHFREQQQLVWNGRTTTTADFTTTDHWTREIFGFCI
jgi:hypothetical protein